MTVLSVFGYNEVVPKSLDLIRDVTELPAWMNGLPTYSLWWIIIHHRWYMNNGDLEYLSEQQDYLFGLLEVLKARIGEDGKENLDGHRFLDWPTSPNTQAVQAGLQSLMVMAFNAGADIADILGEPELGVEYRSTVEHLKKYMPDPNGNKTAAGYMALSGLADADEMNTELLAVNPTSGVSTFGGYYILLARAMAGDYQGALDLIREYWGGMLDLGATSFWEDFDLSWAENAGRIDELTPEGKIDIHSHYGDYCYVGLRHSYCHGWASGPTAWMSQHVLGINVVEPGCTAVRIEPHLGDLEWVEGTYPTPMGIIKVRHEKMEDGSIDSDIELPKGIKLIK